MSIPSIGVEEEYQLVDSETGILRPDCKRVMSNIRGDSDGEIQHELYLNQIEMASPVCKTLDDVRDAVTEVRGLLIESAAKTGTALIAAGINPMPIPNEISLTPKERYRAMTERFQQIARDLLIFGCHVHVSMEDRELGAQVMRHAQRWLPVLQALSANSPYWNGEDTGYASYRRELWVQWPMAGRPPEIESLQDYEDCVNDLVKSGAIKDESHIYWDVRLPTKVPTIEFRVADVMTRIEETVGFAGLVRAIVMQSIRDAEKDVAVESIRHSMLRYAMWQAARFGTNANTVDPVNCETIPIRDSVEQLLKHLSPALDESGDGAIVQQFIKTAVDKGTGADRQRSVGGDQQDVAAVSQQLITETAAGTSVEKSAT